ncbi:MAG: tyrosine-type recombinase/integrase [Endozoicomonas sp.]|uniref:tyrosine-type recombinase/integrase n=1 Tax=Endozoicomonas sp. TaxID=1892382 RepID=UPI003D9B6DB0
MSDTLIRHLPDFKDSFEFFELYDISQPSFTTYRKALKYFGQWLDERHLAGDLPLSPETIKDYLFDLVNQKLKPSTINQRRMAITWLHRMNGYTDETNPMYHPSLRRISKQVRQVRASRDLSNKPEQKEPIRISDLKKLCRKCPTDTLHGLRNRALLLIGFATGLRRSELVNLDVKDIKAIPNTHTAEVFITKSKRDQLAKGQTVIIDAPGNRHCPVAAVNAWREAAQITTGKLFRRIRGKLAVQECAIQPDSAADIIKAYCKKAGLNPKLYSGHSLRRGVLISAIEKGCSLNDVKRHARHSQASTTEHYLGDAVSTRNVTKGLFK